MDARSNTQGNINTQRIRTDHHAWLLPTLLVVSVADEAQTRKGAFVVSLTTPQQRMAGSTPLLQNATNGSGRLTTHLLRRGQKLTGAASGAGPLSPRVVKPAYQGTGLYALRIPSFEIDI